MRKCWASSRGDCEGPISGEHIFSQSLFNSDSVEVEGAPFSPTGKKRIGIKGLTSNILCQLHNSQLSDLDTAAGKYSELLDQVWADMESRSRAFATGKIRRLPTKRYACDGALLERWFFKTTVNIAHVNPAIATIAGTDPSDPPTWLTDFIYEGTKPMRPIGLYTSVNLERTTDAGGHAFSPIVQDGNLVAGLFTFEMFRFVVWLREDRPATVPTDHADWDGWVLLGPEPAGFNVDHDGRHSQVLKYRW